MNYNSPSKAAEQASVLCTVIDYTIYQTFARSHLSSVCADLGVCELAHAHAHPPGSLAFQVKACIALVLCRQNSRDVSSKVGARCRMSPASAS